MSYVQYNLEGIEITAGIGAFDTIGEILKKRGVTKPLLVTDANIRAAGSLALAEETCRDQGIPYAVYDGVEPDPFSDMVDAGSRVYREAGCDGVVSIGGGSVMDVGKGISLMAAHEGNVLEYTRRWPNPKPITKKGCPIINVPTTSGTGSEVSLFAVLANRKNHRKMTLESKYILSDAAVLDPRLAVSLPRPVMVSCFTDALAHAAESYVHAATIAEPCLVSDTLALKAVELLCANVERVYGDGRDLTARMNMMWGALLAGLALNIGAGESHALGAMLSKYHGVPHGYSVGVSLPACLEYGIPSCPQRYLDLARAMGAEVSGLSPEEGARKGVDHLRAMLRRMEFPTMGDYITLEEAKAYSRECSENSCCVLNHRMTTPEQVEKAFALAIAKG